jgi:poly-gamma-glutamate synthesis protein (capsule biosynthesis protein)
MTLAALCAAGLTACAPTADAPAPAPTPPSAAATFTLVATGDVLVHQDSSLVATAQAAGRARGAAYDFSPVLADVAPTIRGADVAVCHLEAPVAPPSGPFTGYPSFSAQPQILDALAGAGYDTCSTASNHSLDAGPAGVVRTLEALDGRGLRHAGTARDASEAATPTVLDVRGVRVAHVATTFGLNGRRAPAGSPWLVDTFAPSPRPDLRGLLADAAAARRAGADVVVASVHCCTEYVDEPTAEQRAVADRLLDSPDVDLVLGHHAHVVQPFGRRGGKWVAHGLGNHVADQRTGGRTRDSVIARFTFARGADGRFAVSRAEAVPVTIRPGGTRFAVVRSAPGDPSYAHVTGVLRKGAAPETARG